MTSAKRCDKCGFPLRKCRCDNTFLNPYFQTEEGKKIAVEKNIIALGGYRAYKEFTFENMQMQSGNLKDVLKQISSYPKENFYIHGKNGRGKTRIATAMVRKFYPHCLIKKSTEILRDMRKACNKSGAEGEEKFLKGLTEKHLVIDDFGVEKDSEFAVATLYEILDKFWMECDGSLIITSNLTPGMICEKTGSERISSRIRGICKVIELIGKDWRLGGQNEK